MLVTWSINLAPPIPEYTKSFRRCWRNFKFEDFINRLHETELCAPCATDAGVDFLSNPFNNVITGLLDQMAPVKEVTLRVRRRQPFFDDDCHSARKQARRLEKVFKAKKTSTTRFKCRAALKSSRKLAQTRVASFWKEQMTFAGNNPRRVWKTVDNILGDAESGAKPNLTPDEYHDFIDKKVTDVQAATASAGCPKFVNRDAPELSTLQPVSVKDVIRRSS